MRETTFFPTWSKYRNKSGLVGDCRLWIVKNKKFPACVYVQGCFSTSLRGCIEECGSDWWWYFSMEKKNIKISIEKYFIITFSSFTSNTQKMVDSKEDTQLHGGKNLFVHICSRKKIIHHVLRQLQSFLTLIITTFSRHSVPLRFRPPGSIIDTK